MRLSLLFLIGMVCLSTGLLHADFKILGGDFKNQRSGPVRFDTDNDSNMDIVMEANANLGIGTTAPTGNVHVVGNLQIDEHMSLLSLSSAPDLQSGNGLLYVLSDNLYFKSAGGNLAQLSDDGGVWALSGTDVYREAGNIGIGTATAIAKLHIQNGGTGNVLNVISNSGEDLITLQNNGDMGVGESTPTAKLHVYEQDNSNGVALKVRTRAGSNVNTQEWIDRNGNTTAWVGNLGGLAGSSLTLRNGNASGITMQFYDTSQSINYGKIDSIRTGTPTQASLRFFNYFGSETETMRIDHFGRMGVGTTGPTGNVHVAGNLQLDEHLSMLDLASAPDTQAGNGLLYSVSGNLFFKDTSGNEAQITNADSVGAWTISEGNVYRSSGNVGLGTSSPKAIFHVVIDDTVAMPSVPDENIVFQNTANTGTAASLNLVGGTASRPRVVFGDTDDESVGWMNFDHTTNSFEWFVTSELMALTSTGRLGLNTSGPTAIIDIEQKAGIVGLEVNVNSADPLHINSATSFGGDLLIVNSAGNMGLGIDAPQSLFHVSGNEDGADMTLVTFDRFTASSANNDSYDLLFNHENDNDQQEDFARIRLIATDVSDGTEGGALTFSTADGVDGSMDEAMRIDQNGNIGIGTTNPNEELVIRSLASNDVVMKFLGASGDEGWIYLSQSDDAIKFYQNPGGIAMLIKSGKVAIGADDTSPDATLEIIDSGGNVFNISSAVGGDGDFVTVDTLGNFGIGVTAPTQTLEVAGNVVASAANTYDLGTMAVTWNNVYSKDFTMISDRRMKENITTLKPGLEEVMKLRPVSYSWKGGPIQERQYGLIAQEVQEVLSDAVKVGDDQKRTMGIHYSNLVPVVIHAIQEHITDYRSKSDEQDQLKARLEKQEEENRKLRRMIEQLSSRLKELKSD